LLIGAFYLAFFCSSRSIPSLFISCIQSSWAALALEPTSIRWLRNSALADNAPAPTYQGGHNSVIAMDKVGKIITQQLFIFSLVFMNKINF